MTKKRTSEFQSEKGAGTENEREDSSLIRRLVETGLAALVSTNESGERTIISPLTLPKEVINYAISQMDRTKSEVVTLFGREFKRFLDATDLSEVVVKALSQMSLEIKAEIRFKPTDEAPGIRPETKTNVRFKDKDSK